MFGHPCCVIREGLDLLGHSLRCVARIHDQQKEVVLFDGFQKRIVDTGRGCDGITLEADLTLIYENA